ncbi:C-X-C Chemokine Receptor Type 2 [Manis pentadactyla]|nr:C-X-C Chemokine Receptor Type 2 [Manis pentadactyla]
MALAKETRREKVLQNVSTPNCSETNGNKTLHWPSLLLKIFAQKNSSFQALATYKLTCKIIEEISFS